MANFNKQDFIQLVLDSNPQGIFWKDRQSNFLGCNKVIAKLAGLNNPEEIVGKNDYDMPWSKEESDFFRKVDQRIMQSGIAELNIEESITNSNGETEWIRTNKIPLRNEQGNIVGIVGTYEVITRQKELEIKLKQKNETLRKANKRLEQINMDLERFSYATSHDLQEPLRTIGAFIGLLKRRYLTQVDKRGNQYIQFIEESVMRMSNIIKNTLKYSRLGKEELLLEQVNITQIIENRLIDLNVIINEKQVNIKNKIVNVRFYCNPDLFGTLFYNLILNAIKYNNKKEPSIEIGHQNKSDTILFYVKDNGEGIPAKFKTKIFEPYIRLENHSGTKGTGLGLSICKRIVNIHNGKIWFDSEMGQGTTFFVEIPKQKQDNQHISKGHQHEITS